MKLFAIRDTKGNFYGAPFTQHSTVDAERTFMKLRREHNSNINLYPQDFDLYHVGNYDNQTGKIQALDVPVHMVNASHLPGFDAKELNS